MPLCNLRGGDSTPEAGDQPKTSRCRRAINRRPTSVSQKPARLHTARGKTRARRDASRHGAAREAGSASGPVAHGPQPHHPPNRPPSRSWGRRLGFPPTTCCLVLNKRRHVVWRHRTPPRVKGSLTRGVHATDFLTLSLCGLLTSPPRFPPSKLSSPSSALCPLADMPG